MSDSGFVAVCDARNTAVRNGERTCLCEVEFENGGPVTLRLEPAALLRAGHAIVSLLSQALERR